MTPNTETKILRILILVIAAALLLSAIAGIVLLIVKLVPASSGSNEKETEETTKENGEKKSGSLPLTADAGISYQDKLIFLGESTTAHLRSRGVLTGGTDTKQVWADSSNTMRLSSAITSVSIIYPDTDTEMTIVDAAALKQPEIMVLSFGLNGIAGFIGNKKQYIGNYERLIDAIKKVSPDTKFIIQSVYPVTENADPWNFLKTQGEINADIRVLNTWLDEFAGSRDDVAFADTASVVTGDDGYLIDSFSNDGIHLTAEGYNEVLYYLRTHAWQ